MTFVIIENESLLARKILLHDIRNYGKAQVRTKPLQSPNLTPPGNKRYDTIGPYERRKQLCK